MKASDSYRIKLGACAALAGSTLVAGFAMAIGASAPTVAVPFLADLGVGAEARADRAAASTDIPLSAALAENRAAIKAAPMSAAPWLRVAYMRSRNDTALDGPALEAIERSYTVAPFGSDVTYWRLNFLYNHWRELTPEIRAEAAKEHFALALDHGYLWRADAVVDPAGRMAATFTQTRGLMLREEKFAQKQ